MAHLPDTRHSLLVRLADADDRAAWDEFVGLYRYAVLGYCRSRGLQPADAEEVLQEVLLVVHRKIAHWSPSGRTNSFRVWLLRTAHRQCLKSLRQRNRIVGTTDSANAQELDQVYELAANDISTIEADWQSWAFQWAAQQIQQEVEATSWQCFWQTAVQQRPAEQVAAKLNIRVGSVYTNKCRVLNKIRTRVQELSRGDQ